MPDTTGSSKEAVVMIRSAHQSKNDSQADWGRRSQAWLDALSKGAPAPLAAP
jgi:hypothetical protein